LPRGESVPSEEVAAELFVKSYEWALESGDRAEIDKREEKILIDVFNKPSAAVCLYDSLSHSNRPRVRYIAALGIDKAFKCDREAVGPIWNRLLLDDDPDVSEVAYHIFSDFCSDIEIGLEHNCDLGSIYLNYSEPDIKTPRAA